MKCSLGDVFPTKWSAIVFVMYILLFVNQGFLVTLSQDSSNSYQYNTVVAVLLTELIKLFVCVLLYSCNNPITGLFAEAQKHTNVMLLYFVPAMLYCIYNNLAYINLSTFDPTTYFLILELRVVVTGIIFQAMFKKELSRKQWLSLILLTLGCISKQIHFGDEPPVLVSASTGPTKLMTMGLSISSVLIIAQVLCSCVAGVYNEYLLKSGYDVDIYIQNIFMYIDSIICNLVVLHAHVGVGSLLTSDWITPFKETKVILVVVNNAAIGIVTSFFLRSLNSILKNYASGLELVLTAITARVLFSIPVYMNTIVAILLILFASVLYSQSPVHNHKIEMSRKPRSLVNNV